ncbi:MAG: DUF5916 domain-containing protein [Thermoanaerobaculia bacterium]
MSRTVRVFGALATCLAALASPSAADDSMTIARAPASIVVDGDLSEPGWQQAAAVTTWYETNPGDNLEPKVGNVAYLAYDEDFFYAAFEFHDPDPGKIRAPLADRDNVPSSTDYGGVILDTRNDGKTAQMFLANPRGVQYDAINSDVTGEDSSPDFFWDAAARINSQGWTLEMRIPFSSLRYDGGDPQIWRVLLYRNYPRDFRYQMFSSRLPRDVSCFICNAKPLTGLDNLPSGSHYVIAPYVTATQLSEPEDGLGTPLSSAGVDPEPGLDFKWIPNPDTAIDATINPDFSQIESDVAQISSNERFALFFPEKRPFFLEGIDLYGTPIQAVYTRSFTSPSWGTRATGKIGKNAYTLMLGEDHGGGSVILPGPDSSDLADQDFKSMVVLGRWRRDLGEKSFVSFLLSDREVDSGGYNRVFGPDFQWRPNDNDTVTGQLLFSRSETPNRPDLAAEWDGRELSGYGAELWWHHDTETVDWFVLYQDFDEEFRADNGFVPQVGYREGFGEMGYTFRFEDQPIHRLRVFSWVKYEQDQQGGLISREFSPGFGMSGKWDSFFRLRLSLDEIRSGHEVFARERLHYRIQISPSRALSDIRLVGTIGDEVDFAHDRLGSGGTVQLSSTFRPSDRLELRLNADRRWLDVDREDGRGGRLFTSSVARLRGTYNLSSKSYVRLIGQWVETERDPGLYVDEVDPKSEFFAASALFAYKLNWQTVLFLGYGDNREYDPARDRLEDSGRQLFLKVSYAFQR